MRVELEEPDISDAKRYLEILSHPDFTYFPAKLATLKEEQDLLRTIKFSPPKKRLQYNFAILANEKHVGAAEIKTKEHYPYISEIGYFVDHRKHRGGFL